MKVHRGGVRKGGMGEGERGQGDCRKEREGGRREGS